ncbi:MAG: hypothetical protein ACOX2P_04330 [Bacillota bacterium]
MAEQAASSSTPASRIIMRFITITAFSTARLITVRCGFCVERLTPAASG